MGVEVFPATAKGYRALHRSLGNFGTVALVGIEGTGSYGAGLTRHLHRSGVRVVEVDRPNRQVRRRRGKSDPVDAIAAARAALSGDASVEPKTRTGAVESIRVLRLARSSARKERTRAVNQMRSIVSTAPEAIREDMRDLPIAPLLERAAAFRPAGRTDVLNATKIALRMLARRALVLAEEMRELDVLLDPIVEEVAPELLTRPGVGHEVAGALLVAAGDNPQRLRSEAGFANLCGVSPLDASSGKQQRHRLNRGGDRQANSARSGGVAHDPHDLRPRYQGLHRQTNRRRAQQTRGHALPQALRCPGALPLPTPAKSGLTALGASICATARVPKRNRLLLGPL